MAHFSYIFINVSVANKKNSAKDEQFNWFWWCFVDGEKTLWNWMRRKEQKPEHFNSKKKEKKTWIEMKMLPCFPQTTTKRQFKCEIKITSLLFYSPSHLSIVLGGVCFQRLWTCKCVSLYASCHSSPFNYRTNWIGWECLLFYVLEINHMRKECFREKKKASTTVSHFTTNDRDKLC